MVRGYEEIKYHNFTYSFLRIGLDFISFVYQHMSNYIYKQAYMIYKTGFRRKSVDLFESVSHFAIAK